MVRERGFLIDNLLVRIQRCFGWTGLAPWDFEFPFPGSLISTFLASLVMRVIHLVPSHQSSPLIANSAMLATYGDKWRAISGRQVDHSESNSYPERLPKHSILNPEP